MKLNINTINALKGKGDTGKSLCLRLLYEKLIQTGRCTVIQSNIHLGFKDFYAILLYKGKKIGITTCGNIALVLQNRIKAFEKENCDIIFCACRSYDKGNNGTNSALVKFKNYNLNFVPKTRDSNINTQNLTNQNDADTLFLLI